jgi:hypothetical protein
MRDDLALPEASLRRWSQLGTVMVLLGIGVISTTRR